MTLKTSKNELFKSRARALNDAGLGNFDLRRNPSDYQKRKAREQFNANKKIIQHPENYTVKVISKSTAKELDCETARVKLKSGKTKVWINNEGGKVVKLNRDHSVTIGEQGKDKYSRRVYPGGKNIFKTAEKLFKKFFPNNVPADDDDDDSNIDPETDLNPEGNPYYREYLMVNIGAAKDFSKSTTFNPESFNAYISAWVPKDAEKYQYSAEKTQEIKNNLISHMNVVRIFNPVGYFGKTEGSNRGKKTKATKKNRRH